MSCFTWPLLREPTDGFSIAAGPALQSASGKGINASEGPVPPFTLILSDFCPLLLHTLLFETSHYWIRAPQLLVSRNVYGSRNYSVHAAFGTQGAYQSNWEGLTDDHLLTM